MCLRHGTFLFLWRERAPACFIVYCSFDSKTVAEDLHPGMAHGTVSKVDSNLS